MEEIDLDDNEEESEKQVDAVIVRCLPGQVRDMSERTSKNPPTHMMNRTGRVQVTSPECALAAEMFDHFRLAGTMKQILAIHREMCNTLNLKPTRIPDFYPKLKAKLASSWKAQALFKKFDARANNKVYNKGKACPQTKVLIIGAGPCGMRAAIECQLLGAKVVVIEKRDRLSRNNVLHLWPFVIHDLRALGAKKFFGKFCAGSIDHISIRQLQCILMKVALLLGVEFHEGVSFEDLLEPTITDNNEKLGWRAQVTPHDHPVAQYEFDVLMGADGKRNTLNGFKRKEFRGKLAIAITANFINRHSEQEASVQEISGVAFIFNQKFFKDLYEETGIDLENIVYYKDDTHYFVMTAKKHSLIEKGVILKDYAETAKLLSPDNIDRNALMAYAREAAHFSTDGLLPDMQFALNHYGKPDVALFDFTSMFAAENATKVVEVRGQRLMVCLVGDSLLEPFWPTGSGCARGFLSALDACWAVRSWGAAPANHPLAVIAERESIYRLLAQTTPENLNRDFSSYTLEPSSRYPNLNRTAVAPHQVTAFYDTDDPNAKSQAAIKAIQSHQTNIGSTSVSSKKRKRESHVHADALLHWLRKQVAPFPHITVDNLSHSMRSGQVLCAVIHRYRPDLIDIDSLQPDDVQGNNQLAFDVLERELGINPVMTGIQMAESEVPDEVKMMAYLSNIYDTFKGEIPHVKHPHYDLPDMEKKYHSRTPIDHSLANYSGKIAAAAEKRNESLKKNRKRRNYHSGRYNAPSTEERVKKLQEFANRSSEKHSKRHDHRNVSKEQFCKSVRMLHFNARREFNTDPFDDYSLYVYRQQAPQFDDRVKELEKKLTQRERDRSTAPMKGLGPMEDSIHSKIKSVDELLRGGASMSDKKPKDLLRAIGKIESSDWNVKEIEKKIKENHLGKSPAHGREKVPKWNREQFLARQTKLERHGVERQESCEGKFREIDTNMKRLDRKIKEGNVLEVGTRGKNKVANLLDQFVKKTEAECEKPAPVEQGHQLMKTNSKVALNLNNKNQLCRACTKPVYVVERLTAEGFTFHKACFKCHFCSTTLRVGTYSYDRNGQYGNNFFCTQHFGLMGKSGKSVRDQYEDGVRHQVTDIAGPDLLDRGETPERIGLVVGIPTDSGRAGVGAEEEDGAEMDEDEWTDRNFGASELSSNGILSGGGDDSSSDEEFSQALEKLGSDGEKENSENESEMDSDSENEYDSDESDSFSYDEYSTGDETSEASGSDGGVPSYGTERSVERAARELRRQEVPPAPQRTPTTTDTEVGSEEETSKTSEVANSATEVSTDSEFAHDDPTPTRELPYITINDENVTKTRGSNFHRSKQANVKKDFGAQEKSANNKKTQNAPFGAVKVRVTGGNDKNVTVVKPAIEILERPLSKPVITAPVRPSEFLLCRTQSTSGIATKRALELKKKYLLGNPSTLSIQKSDSASRLDSKFKSFQSNISECQKLLNAPAESSPCMRAFLASASERNYPKSPTLSTPVGLDFNKTESADDINCNKKDIPMPDIIRNLCERSETNNVYDKIVDDLQICDDKKDSLDLTKRNDEDNNSVPDETRANDDIVNIPTAETHIIVPKVPWNKTDEIEQHSRTATDIESDSLSELDTSSGAVEKKLSGASSTVSLPVPRVQIHDTSGELMQMDSLMIVDGKYVGPIDSDDDCNDKLVNDPPPTQEVKEIKRVDDQTEEVTKPPTNSSNNSSESTNDVTTLAHTETELSDWAYDGAMGEMEHYDDTEFKLGVANKNLHRLKKPKNIHKSKLLDDAANTENQQHVCGKNSTPVEVRSPYMKAVEEFDFMDMGSQDSLIDAFATTDNALMKNRGFMEIIDIEDDKVSTVHNINNRDLNSPVNDRSMNFIEQSACVINNTDVLSTKIGVEGFISSPIDKYDTKGSNTDVHQEKVIEDLSVELKSDNFHGQSSNDNNSDYVVEMESVLSLTTTTDTNAPTSVLEDINIKVDEKEQNKCKDNIAVGNGKDQTNLSENKTEDVAIDSITNDVMTSIHNKLNSKLSCQVSHSNMIITVEPLSNEGINFVKPNLIRAKSFVQMEADACTSRKVQEIMKAKDKQKDLVRDLVLDRLSASRPERRSTKRVRNSPEVNKYNAKDFIIERIVLERQGPPIADLKLHPQVVGNKNIVPGKGNLKVSLNRSNSSQNKSTLPMIVKTNNASPLRSPRKSMEIPFETTFTALKDDSGLPSSQSKKPFASRSTEISSMSSGIVRSCTASDVAKTSLSDSHLFSPLPAEHQNSTESSMVSGELKRLTLNEAIAFKNVSAIKQEKQGTKENKRSQMKMTSMSDPNLSDFVRTERKGKTKDKERRKSIIQTVSNFFNKRLSPKSKETSKLVSCSDYDTPKKSHSEWSVRAVAEAVNLEPESPPPVPPLPLNYELPSTTSSATVLSNRRSSLSDSSVQLAASEARTRLLEREVAELEDELRKSEHGDQSVVGLARGAGGDAETLGRWFDARRRLAAARHEWRTRAGREADLRLAERHARLLRRLRRSDLSAAEESAVVGEMMQISAQRESLTAMREQDKTRIQQFDEGTLDPQILAALTKRKN